MTRFTEIEIERIVFSPFLNIDQKAIRRGVKLHKIASSNFLPGAISVEVWGLAVVGSFLLKDRAALVPCLDPDLNLAAGQQCRSHLARWRQCRSILRRGCLTFSPCLS